MIRYPYTVTSFVTEIGVFKTIVHNLYLYSGPLKLCLILSLILLSPYAIVFFSLWMKSETLSSFNLTKNYRLHVQ